MGFYQCTLVLLLCALIGGSAAAQEISALDLLRKRPASAFDVGFVKLERLLNRIESPLWSYTYDLADYGDDFESYSLKYPAVDYRYGYPLAHRESGKLVLVGVALAQGKFRSAETCGTVMARMREELLVSETTAGGSQLNRARSFIERTFGIEEPWTDDDTSSELADHLLEEVVLELRLYQQLPSDAPDAICRGFLHHDKVEYQS
jgi:hypothetical protein